MATTPTLLRHYIIGLIIFSMVITGSVALIFNFQAEDGDFINSSDIRQLNKSFNVISELETEIGTIQEGVEGSRVEDESIIGRIISAMDMFIVSVWSGIKLMGTSVSFVTIFTAIPKFLGVPVWVGASISLIIVTFIIFVIISLMFKKDI